MSDKKLISWFEKRREDLIVAKTQEHINVVALCVQEFERAVEHHSKGDDTTALESIERAMTYEHEADGIENLIYEELSKGELEPKDRYDLMRLVRQADYIADKIKSVSRILKIIMTTDCQIDPAMLEHVLKLSKTTTKATITLKEAINDLGSNNAHCKVALKTVIELEKVADDQYYEAKTFLFSKEPKSLRVLILQKDLIESIEQASDYCKSTAEMVDLLIVSGR